MILQSRMTIFLSLLLVHCLSASAISSASCDLLRSKTLKTIGSGSKPFLNMRKFEKGAPTGVDRDILDVLAKKLGFQYTFHVMENFAQKAINGTWNGAMGELRAKRADMALGQKAISLERTQAVSFSRSTSFSSLKFITRKPNTLPRHFNLLEPFPKEMWILIIMTASTITPVFAYFSARKSIVWLNVLGSIVGNASIDELRANINSKFIRALLLLWSLFCTLIIFSYLCNLKANLMKEEFEPFVNSAQDLIDQGKHFYLLKGGFQHAFFKQSTRKVYQQLYMDVERNNRFYDHGLTRFLPRNIRMKVLQGHAVAMDERYALEYVKKYVKRDVYNPLWVAEEKIASYSRGFALSNASLKLCFDPVLSRMFDAGIVAKMFSDHSVSINSGKIKEKKRDTKDVPLKIDQLLFAWILLPIGLILSSVVFCYEMKIGKGSENKRRNRMERRQKSSL